VAVVDDALLAGLKRVLLAGPSLQLAVVFGSTARGERHPLSDVDIAIIPADASLSLGDELQLQTELERACGVAVDLVRLDRAPLALRWRVARDGVPLVGATTGAWARFAARTASEHADIAPALSVAGRRFQQRLAAEDAE
jgi:predicted nucleotidyltransferase